MDEMKSGMKIAYQGVKEEMETGTTKIVETKTDADLSNASSIEYSIISK